MSSTSVLVIDHQHGKLDGATPLWRDWASMLGVPTTQVQAAAPAEVPEGSRLVLVHGAEPLVNRVKDKCAANSTPLLIISGSPGRPNASPDGLGYRRGARVTPANERRVDPVFAACWSRFWTAFTERADGAPIPWELLEPPPAPSRLYAALLLSSAKLDEPTLDVARAYAALRGDADLERIELVASFERSDPGPLPATLPDSHDELIGLVERLRSLLAPNEPG